jgi:hypothetical protein
MINYEPVNEFPKMFLALDLSKWNILSTAISKSLRPMNYWDDCELFSYRLAQQPQQMLAAMRRIPYDKNDNTIKQGDIQ